MRYTMKNLGYQYKVITQGRRSVGRVYRTTTGYGASIGTTHTVQAATELEAFHEVVARACGFGSHAALRAHNSTVSASNRAIRAQHRSQMRRFTRNDLENPLETLIGRTMAPTAFDRAQAQRAQTAAANEATVHRNPDEAETELDHLFYGEGK
jgi:hypothetical protein